jgi:hypothetical protein
MHEECEIAGVTRVYLNSLHLPGGKRPQRLVREAMLLAAWECRIECCNQFFLMFQV